MIIEVVSLDLEVRSRIIHLSSTLSFIHGFKKNYSRLFVLYVFLVCSVCSSQECRESP